MNYKCNSCGCVTKAEHFDNGDDCPPTCPVCESGNVTSYSGNDEDDNDDEDNANSQYLPVSWE